MPDRPRRAPLRRAHRRRAASHFVDSYRPPLHGPAPQFAGLSVQYAAHTLAAPVANATCQQSITEVSRTIESFTLQALNVQGRQVVHRPLLDSLFESAQQTWDRCETTSRAMVIRAAFPAKVTR